MSKNGIVPVALPRRITILHGPGKWVLRIEKCKQFDRVRQSEFCARGPTQTAKFLAHAFRQTLQRYGQQVVENARALAVTLSEHGIGIVGGGTDTHMVLLDLASVGLLGSQAEAALARAGITSNRNPVPFDARNSSKWTGLRLGVSAATTRGMTYVDMGVLGECTADLLHAEAHTDLGPALARAKPRIARLAQGKGKCDEFTSERNERR